MGLFVGYAQGSRVGNWSYICVELSDVAVWNRQRWIVPEVILHVTGERLIHEEELLHVKYEIE